MRQRTPWWSLVALLAAIALSCSKDASPEAQRAEPSVTASIAAPATQAAGTGPGRLAPSPRLPSDVVAAVDAIFDARSLDDATAATQVVLERSGVVVTDDPTKGPRSQAGLYLPPELVRGMAEEARLRGTLSRVTFGEFASTLAGAAGLPSTVSPRSPMQLNRTPAGSSAPADRDPAAPPAGQSETTVTEQAQQLAAFVSRWVELAAANHGRLGDRGRALTAAPLMLATLAQRQEPPLDLGAPFLADEWRLGALDTTLLIAGLRTTLASGRPEPPRRGDAQVGPSTLTVAFTTQAAGDPCDALKNWMDSWIPQAIDALGTGAGELVEAYVATVLEGFGANAAAGRVGTISNILSIIFRIQTLALLYSESSARMIATPHSTHKPTGTEQLAAAEINVGVRDGRWDQFRRDQRDSPVYDLLRRCARLVGVPVPSELGDIGEAMKNWRVAWSIPVGSGHVLFAPSQFDDPRTVRGRLERPLSPQNDHRATDTIALAVQPEQRSDHPGDEVAVRVVVCGAVRTSEPPNITTFLNAGLGGKDLVAGAVDPTTLAAAIVDIFAGWFQFVFTIDACDDMEVRYHVALQGPWKGTISARSEHNSFGSARWSDGDGTTRAATSRDQSVLVEELHLGGRDVRNRAFIDLKGQAFAYGSRLEEFTNSMNYRGFRRIGFALRRVECVVAQRSSQSASGSFNFQSDAGASIALAFDGTYTIRYFTRPPEASDFTLPGARTAWTRGGEECGFRQSDSQGDASTLPWLMATGYDLTGAIDPASPGDRLQGSKRFTAPDGTTSVVKWDLRHEGPIPIPTQGTGG